MRLPHGEKAVVEVGKLRDYCLNPQHHRGRHKARVFARALGLTQADAELLRDALLIAATEADATPGERDEYGQRYVLDFPMSGPSGRATVRSNWIILEGETFPRLTSCYVL